MNWIRKTLAVAMVGALTIGSLATRDMMDEHGPNSIRGGFTFSLFDEFYDAFDIKEGDAMYVIPKYRVKLWS